MTDQTPPPAYRVLARKYRPKSFGELYGHEAMVRTLGNAIARDKLAHAYLLTGVRGVGKTTTARLIAKSLNCVGPDGQGGPTVDPCGQCEPCLAIAESRHIDVIEMDAASRTGVDDVREIIEAARYAAVSARYKIYIVDEVHMLSRNAFNALLKTLEEPPAHVKFIFATTEVHKLPVTVLSRCQRFDLRRIPGEKLEELFANVAKAEGATVAPEAIALIARAAEGSARDGLSILDQAIAHAGGEVTAEAVRDMLGLADRGQVRALMGDLLAGRSPEMLARLRDQYDLGINPEMIVQELLELIHRTTRAKVAGLSDKGLAEEERAAIADWAERLSLPSLHRLWQLLLKGLSEIQTAPLPIQATEMALLRVIHASSLPDPGELVRRLVTAEVAANASPPSDVSRSAAPGPVAEQQVVPHPRTPPAPAKRPVPADFGALVTLFEDNREPLLAKQLHDDVYLVSYKPPRLSLRAAVSLSADFAQRVMRCLELWTGERWTVSLTDEPGEPSLREQEERRAAAERAAVLAEPLVRRMMEAFPGAELIDFGLDEPAGATSSDQDNDLRRA